MECCITFITLGQGIYQMAKGQSCSSLCPPPYRTDILLAFHYNLSHKSPELVLNAIKNFIIGIKWLQGFMIMCIVAKNTSLLNIKTLAIRHNCLNVHHQLCHLWSSILILVKFSKPLTQVIAFS